MTVGPGIRSALSERLPRAGRMRNRLARSVAGCVAILGFTSAAAAQELEPRAYSPSPVGTTFIVISGTRSTGGVFTDPSAPITDVSATVDALGLGIGHTFGIAGKQALLLGLVPIARGNASGSVGEDSREVNRRGLADARLKFSMILAGAPARTRQQFAGAPRRTILGASVLVGPPTGQYEPTHLVNLGAHRWSIKPEAGVSYPVGRWTIDGYAGVWFFTGNDTYYPGSNTRSQDPILALQGHVSRIVGRRAWVAGNATWYRGGTTSINGVDKGDLQQNTRVGVTWSQPLGTRQSIKFAYSTGATTRIGADFRTFTVAWQMVLQ
jgi:outer membrane putative beta-barrel porin/alpha-amylase